MKKMLTFFLMALLLLLCTMSAGASEEGRISTFQRLDEVERIVYARSRDGGLIMRLSSLEKDLFGRELPGSIADRQNALVDFIEKGTNGQPSMLFKVGVAEWAVEQEVHPERSFMERVGDLEKLLEGSSMTDKPLAMRLERLLSLLLSEPVQWQDAEIPESTVIRAELEDTLSPANTKVGDNVDMKLAEDLLIGELLVASRGSSVAGHVSEVKKPRSFGVPSEIKVDVDVLYPLGPDDIPVMIGEEAKSAGKAEMSQLAAAGSSFVGAILLGPLGLAGGLLVRGDAKDVPAGTPVFVQVSETTRVSSFPVPEGLRGLIAEKEKSPDVEESEEEAGS